MSDGADVEDNPTGSGECSPESDVLEPEFIRELEDGVNAEKSAPQSTIGLRRPRQRPHDA